MWMLYDVDPLCHLLCWIMFSAFAGSMNAVLYVNKMNRLKCEGNVRHLYFLWSSGEMSRCVSEHRCVSQSDVVELMNKMNSVLYAYRELFYTQLCLSLMETNHGLTNYTNRGQKTWLLHFCWNETRVHFHERCSIAIKGKTSLIRRNSSQSCIESWRRVQG